MILLLESVTVINDIRFSNPEPALPIGNTPLGYGCDSLFLLFCIVEFPLPVYVCKYTCVHLFVRQGKCNPGSPHSKQAFCD